MSGEQLQEARFYERQGEKFHCLLCPHGCLIAEGKSGLCGVRQNRNGRLYALSYGQISSLALDPIEKKPLFHFHPGRYILSVGSYGCNMRCAFCQNSAISQEKPRTQFLAPRQLVEVASRQPGNLGVAFTYNEPVLSMEYLLDTAPLLREAGLKVVLVTNGLVEQEPLRTLLPDVDALNIDVKGFNEEYYRKLGGDLATVKQSVASCLEAGCHVEITTLVVPGENDSASEIVALSGWLAALNPELPLHLSRFFPRYQMPDKPPTPLDTLQELARLARQKLRYVYVGNV